MTNLEELKIEIIVNKHNNDIKRLFCSMGTDLQNLLLKAGYELKSPDKDSTYTDSKPFLFALARLEQLVLGPIKLHLYNPTFEISDLLKLEEPGNNESF